MTPQRLATVHTAFHNRFSGQPSFTARAPGRVNIIGEHTDYNKGFVLPCALDFDVIIAARPRADETFVMLSLSKDNAGETSFPVDNIEQSGPRWAQYIKGVAWALGEAGYDVRGMDLVIEGDVPISSGLSSSAALEVAAATAMAHAAGLRIPGPELALVCQRAENEFVGVNSGIMDQFISAVGQEGNALFLDCNDLSYRHVPFDVEPDGLRLVVMNTCYKRSLKDSIYNDRVDECAAAVDQLAMSLPGIRHLRDVSWEQFLDVRDTLDEVPRRRAAHVISENRRVLEAVEAMASGDWVELGRLMDASHDSLQVDYEATGPHLDAMVEEARKIPGTIGSRMTGAGFGGCAVALVREDAVEQFKEQVSARYRERMNLEPGIYAVKAAAGAGIV